MRNNDAPSPSDRRRAIRTLRADAVSVSHDSGSLHAILEDISATGVGVSVQDPMEPGTHVAIRSLRGLWKGVVRRCEFRSNDGLFLVGIEFVADEAGKEKGPVGGRRP